MTLIPTQIRRISNEPENLDSDSGIEITWSDNHKSFLSTLTLRGKCPCATCLQKRGDSSHEKPLSPTTGRGLLKVVKATSDEEIKLVEIRPVGNYGISILWGDEHATGIYTYDYLLEISKQ